MKAAITTKAGAPTVIEIQEVAKPEVKPGWVLIRCSGLYDSNSRNKEYYLSRRYLI